MPNHVRNIIKINKLTPDEVDQIVNSFTYVNESGDKILDFNRIIPEPRDIKDCPIECQVNKDSHVELDKSRPWFDWYKWRLAHWDTKWDAYDGYTLTDTRSVTFVFSTAWSAPVKIYQKLADIGYDIQVRWADEDLGNNCGKAKYNRREQRWDITPDSSMKNSRQFANLVWRY